MDIKVYVANNEQKPWSVEEIGYQTFPMETKAASGIRQVGDYFATCDDEVIPILVERKSLQDAYGSFIIEKNRGRLYAEIVRYQDDPRFNEFIIIVEATRTQFMAYYPFSAVLWHKERGSLKRFFGATRKKKVTVVEHLEERGAKVVFAGDRVSAALTFSTTVDAYISTHKEDL